MIYIFYISFFLKYNTVDEKVKKGMISVETIFPREENAEHIFKKILENNDACERLRELFYEEFANRRTIYRIMKSVLLMDFVKNTIIGTKMKLTQ